MHITNAACSWIIFTNDIHSILWGKILHERKKGECHGETKTKENCFIGAGSFIFTRNLCRDILTFDAFRNCELWLVDINPEHLEMAHRMVQRYVNEGHYPATVHCTTDRCEALPARTVFSVPFRWEAMMRSRMSWGFLPNLALRQPSAIPGAYRGFFCYLRTVQTIVDIAADVQRLCPNAVFLNYTNPMAMLCRTVQTLFPKLRYIGLCHSVQETIMLLAKWLKCGHQRPHLYLRWHQPHRFLP